MAVEPWNKVNIPRPSAASTSRIEFSAAAGEVVEGLTERCGDALKLFGSELLRTEVHLLHELLYLLNNSQRHHSPFRAIRQVEQCINRLNEMNLQWALQDLQELCPNKIQRVVGVDVGHCDVPSQPVLEWFCLKLLGASQLLARTLDQCTKAFLLTKQHLRLAEFIVLNLVLLSMLSRLWVFFRGILKALVPVYQKTIELRQQVAKCWPMPYLTNFTLPEDLESFLSPTHCDLLDMESSTIAPKSSALDKLFKEKEEEQVEDREREESKMMQILTEQGLGKSSMDLGNAVLRENPLSFSSSSGMDIKLMLQQNQGVSKQCVVEVFRKASPEEYTTSDPDLVQQKKAFLKQLRAVSSFSEMSVQLKMKMDWCRKCKLHQERQNLGLILLKCQRMKSWDTEELKVQKKLRRLCSMVQHVLLKKRDVPPKPSSPSFLQRTRCCFRNRFMTLMARYGSVRYRLKMSRKPFFIARDLFGVTAEKKSTKNVIPKGGFVKEKKLESDVCEKGNTMAIEKELEQSVKKSEIDDIFAQIGF